MSYIWPGKLTEPKSILWTEYNSKVLAGFFVDIGKLILKYRWKGKGPRIAKIIWKTKKGVKGFTLLDVKTLSKAK